MPLIQYKACHTEFQRLNVATPFRMSCDIIGMCSNTSITAVFNELTDVFRALLEIPQSLCFFTGILDNG